MLVTVFLVLFTALPFAGGARAVSIADLSNQETVQGLKEALVQGADKAVSQLGALDGFLGNQKVKIPLPDSLRRVERVMRMMGMGAQADDLVTNMNRAAALAGKEAKPRLVAAVTRG